MGMVTKKKSKAVQIANHIINGNLKVNNLHLQKLLYYLQVNYMIDYDGRLLFEDKMEKWKLGPVVPNVYHAFKDYGHSLIESPYRDFTFKRNEDAGFKVEFVDINLNDKEVEQYIDKCLQDLKQYDRFDLVDFTHKHDPWKKDEIHINNGIRNIVYDNNELMDYFNENKELLLVERD